MNIKKLALFLLCLLIPVFSRAETQKDRTEQKLTLSQNYTKLLAEMGRLRTKLIAEEEELKKLHEKIIELHTELASKLEKNPEMKALYEKLMAIEKEMEIERKEKKL